MMVSGSQAALLLVLAVLFAIWRVAWPRPIPGIAHNSLKLFGDLPEIIAWSRKDSMWTWFLAQQKKYPRMCQAMLGARNVVLVFDPILAHQILVNRTPSCFDRDIDVQAAYASVAPSGMFAMSSDHKHQRHRKGLAGALAEPCLSRFATHMAEEAHNLVKLWSTKRTCFKDAPFSVKQDIHMCLSDIIARIVLNESFANMSMLQGFLHWEDNQLMPNKSGAYDDVQPPHTSMLLSSIEYLTDMLSRVVMSPLPKSVLVDWETRRPAFRRAKAYVWSHLDGKLEAARAEQSCRGRSAACVLEMLVDKEAAEELAMTDEEILDELFVLLEAGSEMSASTLMWSVKLLAKHPQIQRKLRDHLNERVPAFKEQRLPTLDDLAAEKAPYLSAVVYEMLRCSLQSAGGSRDALEDTMIDGVAIPAGTRVVAMCNAETIEAEDDDRDRPFGRWQGADSSVFSPERWLEYGEFHQKAGPLLAFSLGPRACWGRSIAILELKMLVFAINRAFFLDSVAPQLDTLHSTNTLTAWPHECYLQLKDW